MHCIHGNPVAGGAVDAAGLPGWGAEWSDEEYLAESRKLEKELAAESDWLEDAAADKDGGSSSDPRKSESSNDWAKSPRGEVCVEKTPAHPYNASFVHTTPFSPFPHHSHYNYNGARFRARGQQSLN